MQLFKQHPKSALILISSFIAWIPVLYSLFANQNPSIAVCDFSAPFFIFFAVLTGIFSVAAFAVKAISSNEPFQTDYLVFLGLATLPLMGLFVWAMAGNG